MTETTLVYFGTHKTSIYGTLRGAAAIVPLILVAVFLTCLFNPAKVSTATRVWTIVLGSLVLCSAIGVQLPRSYNEAGQYGALVGLVVSVMYVCLKAYGTGSVKRHDLYAMAVLIIVMASVALWTMFVSLRYSLYVDRPF